MIRKSEFRWIRRQLVVVVFLFGASCLLLAREGIGASVDTTIEHCTDAAAAADQRFDSITHRTVAQSADIALPELMQALSKARVVVVGETHDNWTHHLTQLEIACRLVTGTDSSTAAAGGVNASWGAAAIGFEQFQTPAQTHLDDFANGQTSIAQLLDETDYFTNWGYDFRLYEPIISWAAGSGLALLALNASAELVELVRENGLDHLGSTEKSALPFEVESVSDKYRQRLMDIFNQHAVVNDDSTDEVDAAVFQRFVDVQRTWEGTMTATAVRWLKQNPESRLIILVGAGHMLWPATIPDQLREQGVDSVVSVAMDVGGYVSDSSERPDDVPEENLTEVDFANINVDYSLQVSSKPLRPSGKMGVALETTTDGVSVSGFARESAAQTAGIKIGDRITAINGELVSSYNQIRQLLWRSEAGEQIELRIIRDDDNGGSSNDSITFSLR